MNVKIEDMRNLGPATAGWLAEVDIENEDELRKIGAVDAYRCLKFRFGGNVSLLALYAMEAALQDCDWRMLSVETRAMLKAKAQKL